MAKIFGLGNSDNFMESLSELEKEIKKRNKNNVNSTVDKSNKQLMTFLNDTRKLIGQDNKKATARLNYLIKQNKIQNDMAQKWIEKIQNSLMKTQDWEEIKNLWLEEAKRNEVQDKEKKKELNLWNVLRAGIRSLIPDETGKKAREVWNLGIKTLGNKFFKDLSKNFTKYMLSGLQFFGMASLWTLLILGILALFDPKGVFIDALINGIQAILPIVVGLITNIIERLPQLLASVTYLFKRVFTELIPVILSSVQIIVDLLIKAIPDILIMVGRTLDDILSIVFGRQIKLFEPLMKLAGDIFVLLVNVLKEIIPVLFTLLKEILPPIITILGDLFPVIAELLNILLPVLVVLLKDVVLPLTKSLLEVLIPALDFINHFLNLVKGILTFDKDLILSSIIGMVASYSEAFLKLWGTILFGLPKVLYGGLLKGPTSLLGKYAKYLFEKMVPKAIQKLIKEIVMKVSNVFGGLKGSILGGLQNLREDPAKATGAFFKTISQNFSELSKWWRTHNPLNIVKSFFNVLQSGFLSLIYNIAGFFSYFKNRNWKDIIQDFSTGKAFQQVSLRGAEIATEGRIDLSYYAKMDAKKNLTGKDLLPASKQLTKNEQDVFYKLIEQARKDDSQVSVSELLNIVKQIGIQQQSNTRNLGDIQSQKYSFEF